jgi:uncharacterized protein (DUF58 family)
MSYSKPYPYRGPWESNRLFRWGVGGLRKRLGLIAVTVMLATGVLVSGSVLVLRVFYAWSLILLAGYLWVVLTLKGISFEPAALPRRAQAGSTLRQTVSLSNHSRLPKFALRVQASINPETSTVVDLPPGKTLNWQAEYYLSRRGLYLPGVYSLISTDPFRLFRRELSAGSPSDLLVHPLTVSMPPFTLLGVSGSGLSKRMPETLSASASNIREYTNGDSLRHIHWRSTAHTGRYMVKVFDPDQSRHRPENYWIILDMGTSAHAGHGSESTVEYAVTLAASLAKEYVTNGYRFGLVIAGEKSKVFTAATGQDHLTEIMDALAVVEPAGSFSFSELLARNQSLFNSNSTVIFITPTTASSLTESYHQLNSRGCAAAYFLIDGADFGGSSPAAVGRTLIQLGAPVYLLRRSENFKQALEQAARATTWSKGASRQ